MGMSAKAKALQELDFAHNAAMNKIIHPLIVALPLLAASLLLTSCFDSGGGGGGGGGGGDFGDNDKNVVVCMGDSITEGGNGEAGPPYPSILAGMSGKTTINEGRGGERAGSGAGRIAGVLARNSPGYVVIFYGANDAIFGLSSDQLVNAIASMVNEARANKTVPIVCTVLPTYDSRAFANDKTAEYSVRIRELAKEMKFKVADVRREFEGERGLLLSDGLHPNDAGIAVIAASVNDRL